MQVLYLHGFASSPESSKATFLSRKFAERGISMIVPDLNAPDFSTLTVTRMLQPVR
ncbi:MAG: esterase, partial [Acidobacteria bacterium]|nr:esterase [Acidobacteriota bacterium]